MPDAPLNPAPRRIPSRADFAPNGDIIDDIAAVIGFACGRYCTVDAACDAGREDAPLDPVALLAAQGEEYAPVARLARCLLDMGAITLDSPCFNELRQAHAKGRESRRPRVFIAGLPARAPRLGEQITAELAAAGYAAVWPSHTMSSDPKPDNIGLRRLIVADIGLASNCAAVLLLDGDSARASAVVGYAMRDGVEIPVAFKIGDLETLGVEGVKL